MVKLADDVIAHVLEQVVADDTDDGIEERNVLDHVGGVVAAFQEGVDSCRQVVCQIIAQYAFKQAQHIVFDAELVFDGCIAQLDKEAVEFLDFLHQTVANLDGLDLFHGEVVLTEH